MQRFEGKVALVTGAARGQGRTAAVRLAAEGADVICIDSVTAYEYPTVAYEMPTPADLEETVGLIEAEGRGALSAEVDVRDYDAVAATVSAGVERFGRLDIVLANAGIVPPGISTVETPLDSWRDVIDINLSGVFHTVKATLGPMIAAGNGGSIVATSSGAGIKGAPNLISYVAAKHGVVGIIRTVAMEAASEMIRANVVAPTSVATDMIFHDAQYRLFRPELENPGKEDMAGVMQQYNLLPIPWIEREDVISASLWLCSDEARYITGITLPVDAGFSIK
jgi:(+)-trans-carveol dehydrogenase